MNYLVDTNILTRLAEPGDPLHRPALVAVKLLVHDGHKLHIVPKNLYEFWVVSTRPTSVNGRGKTATEAATELVHIKTLFHWAEDTPRVYEPWERLVAAIPVIGKNAHDARLVAAMTVHNLTHLLSFNAKDFLAYPNISVVTPFEVAAP